MSSELFKTLFLLFLLGGFAFKYYLGQRQIRSVLAHQGKVPEEFTAAITLEAHRKAAAYTVANVAFANKERVLSLLLTLWFCYGGLLQWLWELSKTWFGQALIGQAAFVLIVGLLSQAISLPLDAYHQFGLEKRFGFSTMTPKQFVKDQLLGLALMAVIGIPLLAAILWLWQSAGQFWWVAAWAVYAAFSLGLTWVYPTWIAPLFNKFQKLPDGELSERIQNLLERTGFKADGLFVMDSSKRSRKANAYMTGFGKNKRIVFFDTLLNKLTPEQTEAVLAHEIGHSRLKHIRSMTLFSLTASFVFFALLAWLSSSNWFYEGLGLTALSDHREGAALVLFGIALPVFLFPITPLLSYLSRKHEYEADAFACQNTNGNALISALVKLFEGNASTLTPDALYCAFYSSHPAALERISAIRKWTQQ